MALGKGRGRPSNSSKWIYFDVGKYVEDLEKALVKVMTDINDEMYKEVRASASALPFKNHKVYTVDGVTSDAERSDKFIASIVQNRVVKLRKGIIHTSVHTMEDNFKDTHIGLYYEYGTGTKEDKDSPLPFMGDWNEYRNGGVPMAGARIVTRPHELFTDAGGNLRVSNSVVPGMPIKTPGWEVQAHHWFSEAYERMRASYFNRIVAVVRDINPISEKYLKVRTEINLGR